MSETDSMVALFYASTDVQFSLRLAGDLHARGIDADGFDDLMPNAEARDVLARHIEEHNMLLVVVSPAAARSPWMAQVGAMLANAGPEKRIIALRIAPLDGELPPWISDLARSRAATVDFTADYDAGLRHLLVGLGRRHRQLYTERLRDLGRQAEVQGHAEEAARYFTEALAIAQEAGDLASEGTILANLGSVANSQGHYEDAERYYEQALTVERVRGNPAGESAAFISLSVLAARRGDMAAAYRYRDLARILQTPVRDTPIGDISPPAPPTSAEAPAAGYASQMGFGEMLPPNESAEVQEDERVAGQIPPAPKPPAPAQEPASSTAPAPPQPRGDHERVFDGSADAVLTSSGPATGGLADLRSLELIEFTAYHPREIALRAEEKLLFFLALASDEARAQIESLAAEQLRERLAEFRTPSAPANMPIARGTRLTITPHVKGITFDPASITVQWTADVQSYAFTLRAEDATAGHSCDGFVDVFEGPILRAAVPLSFFILGERKPAPKDVALVPTRAAAYRNTFPSYARRDERIVRAVEAIAEAGGDRFLRDVRALRAGDQWAPRLLELINSADVFQLFWSKAAARSEQVEREWRHALELLPSRPGFIHPIYWDRQLYTPPKDLQSLNFGRLEANALGLDRGSLLRRLFGMA